MAKVYKFLLTKNYYYILKSIILFDQKIILRFLLSLNMICFTAHANPQIKKSPSILLRDSLVTEQDYTNFVNSTPDYKQPNWTDFYENETALNNIKRLGENEFLESDLSKAKNTFKTLADLQFKSLWSKQSRSSIFHGFFRLAQLEPEKSEEHIKNAYFFAPDLKPDPEFIPQKLIDIFTQQSCHGCIELQNNPSRFINSSDQITAVEPERKYRLDFLGLEYGLHSSIVKGRDIDHYQMGSVEVRGSCDSLSLSKNLTFKNQDNAFVLTKNCGPQKISKLLENRRIQLERLTKKEPTIKLSNTSLQVSPGLAKALPEKTVEELDFQFSKTHPDFNSTKTQTSKKSNRWIYISSFVLALTIGAVLINEQNDNQTVYEPTSRRGF